MKPTAVCTGVLVLVLSSVLVQQPAHAGPDRGSSSDGSSSAQQATSKHSVRVRADARTAPTIGFDEYPKGTAISSQYPGLVIESDGAPAVIASDSAQPTSPVLEGSTGYGSPVTVHFVTTSGKPRAIDRFSVDVGYIDDVTSTVVNTYSPDGALLQALPVDSVGINEITNTVGGVASFTVTTAGGASNDNAGWTLDNLAVPLLPAYVALGDSYSSGEGVKPFDKGTDSKTSGDTCHRSAKAWPRLLADKKGVKLGGSVTLVACSGATTDALTNEFKTEAAQLAQVRNLPRHPTVVTITMGGNDVGFQDILTKCYVGVGCKGRSNEAKDYIATELPGLLADTYESVQQSVGQSTRVVVVGYPNLINPRKGNALLHCPWLDTTGNVKRLSALGTQLDQVAAASAATAGVEYVSALHALKGHELCTAHSYVYRLAPSGGQLRGHPTLKGQKRYASTVADYFKK